MLSKLPPFLSGDGSAGGGAGVVRPQWKAAIDFKWIRDNRDAVADNIRTRNSTANLDLVLELYDQYLTLQKVWGLPMPEFFVVAIRVV